MKRPSQHIRAFFALVVLTAWGPEAAMAAPPVARDDYVVATDRYLELVGGVERYSILIDVLANDEDVDGDRLEIVLQGPFGLPPWVATPAGTVAYLGGGVFDLSFDKDELGDATEVTFQYELEGASTPATVRVTVAGEGPPPDVVARDDVFDDPWACRVVLPVLENDTGLDVVETFVQLPPEQGVIERHPADPNVLVYRGGADGVSFSYTAVSSQSGASATASVSVQEGNRLGIGRSPSTGDIAMADCFERADGVLLDGEQVEIYQAPTAISGLQWTAPDIAHLDASATVDEALPTRTETRTRRAYLPFYTGELEGSAYELRSTVRADGTAGDWIALAFTHGNGVIPQQGDLWVRLDVETGELSLRTCCDGSGARVTLGEANPAQDGYTFVENGINSLHLRYDTGPPTPRVDAWINGARVFSRVPLTGITTSIENVGYFVNYGTKQSAPGDLWFDDFELRVNDVDESRLQPRSGHPTFGADVEDGSTLDLGSIHLGCTGDHNACESSAETSIWLTNEGNQPLEVSHVNFEGPTAWTLLSPITETLTVPAGGSAEVRVRVDALEVGQTTSSLELSSNDPDAGKLTVNFTAEVRQAPVADFVYYCDGLTCSFDGESSTGLLQFGASYGWLVDGGSAGSGPTLQHTFPTTGSYTVALTVFDSTGPQHTVERTVSLAPEPAFTVQCVNATRACDFDAGLTGDGVVSWIYQLGDGTIVPGTDDPGDVVLHHTYATSGVYEVTLTVYDAEGQDASVTHEVVLEPVVDFIATCSADTTSCVFDASLSSPGMALYEWSFGDGSVGSGLQTSRPYATSGIYTVTLTVVDPAGQIDAVSKAVAVPPRAEIDLTCDVEALTCDFDGSGSTPGVSYSWSFGDGSLPASGANPSHTYAVTGVYTVTLTVTDVSGQTASDSRPVVIGPTAAFTFTCDGLVCEFDAGPSSPGASFWSWSFGHDGATGAGATPSHAFPSGGAYQVSLTVTDGSGQTATAVQTVVVSEDETLFLILLGRR